MKKLYLLLTFFVLSCMGSMGQVIFSESFDDGDLPEGWMILDADGDGYNWFPYADAGSVINYPDYYQPYSGSGYFISSSYINSPLTVLNPNNWLISPALVLPEFAELNYYVRSLDPSWPDHYGVFISTTGTSVNDFIPLYEEIAPGDWTLRTVNLSAFAGETVYIAFRHYDSQDEWNLALDEVFVDVPEMCELLVQYYVDGSSSLREGNWLEIYTDANHSWESYVGGFGSYSGTRGRR